MSLKSARVVFVGGCVVGLSAAGGACSDPGLSSGTGGGHATSTTTTTTTTSSAVTTGTGGAGGGTTTGTGGAGGGTTTGTGGAGGGTTTTGAGGAGGGTTTTGAGGAGGGCTNPATDCPPPATVCIQAICVSGACSTMNIPIGTPLAQQETGDCKTAICDGNGGVGAEPDDADLHDDNNPCTKDTCSAGSIVNAPLAAGAACVDAAHPKAKVCDGAVTCVECNGNADCMAPTVCQAHQCLPVSCMDAMKNGTETDIDCGGPTCPKCANGKTCSASSDCTSGICQGGSCQAPTCSDGLKNGSETGVDCGGSCPICPTVLVLGGGNGVSVLAAEFHPGGAWSATSLSDATSYGPSIAITSTGQGVGLIRSNNGKLLRYTLWSPGMFTPFADVGPGITTREQPSIRAKGTTAHAAFHGEDFKYYYAAFTGGAWSPMAEQIGAGAGQSFGPSPPQIVAEPLVPAGTEATIAFINGAGGINQVYARDRIAGSWAAAKPVDLTGTNFNLAPELVPITSGGELMVIFVRSDAQIMYAIRNNWVWSAAAPITSATTDNRVSVTSLPNGAALLAFRGQNGLLYSSSYAGGGMWSIPALVAPNMLVTGSPALAHGVGGATAELAFAKVDGIVYHARYMGGAWTAPVAVGGVGMGEVGIASAP
ncbi:MAG: hypothetical protein U0359_01775 [Byssovorax sp.]